MLFWARIFKITVINHLHGDDFKRFYSNSSIVYKKILKWCYDGVDTSIVLFDEMKPLFNDFPKMNIKVVANAYSSALDSLPSDKFIRNADIEFLFLSNIMESKGIFILLEAFDSVLKVNSDCKLTIAGAFMGDSISECKETKSKFEDKYNKLKQMYDKRINYVGVVKGETKKELLWKSDIFVLPTFYITEAFPVSILEAMRAGCYIISTNHNYIPQIVSPDNGELAKPNSPSSLQAVIEKILKNKERLNQVQRHNIKHAIVNFGEDKYISEVTGIINENLHHHCLLQQ
jgi:glycosyltransferase involved in cell wall biosynthesis